MKAATFWPRAIVILGALAFGIAVPAKEPFFEGLGSYSRWPSEQIRPVERAVPKNKCDRFAPVTEALTKDLPNQNLEKPPACIK